MTTKEPHQSNSLKNGILFGLIIGAGVGVGIGVALKNVGIGVGIGAGIGILFVFIGKRKDSSDD